MKLNRYFLFGMSCLLLTAQPSFSAMEPSGMNDKLGWKVVREFQLANPPVDIAHSLDGRYAFVLTAENEVEVYDAAGTLQGTIPVDKGVTSIALDPRGQYLHMSDREKKKFYTLAVDVIANITTDDAPTKGNKDAPVTIAIFSDFQCPYCGKIAPLLEQVLKKNDQTVKIVFKNLPLPNHEEAQPAALAALAAGQQGKFWEYHDKLFAEEKVETTDFERIAKELGLDIDMFKKDMASAQLQNQLRADMLEAQQLGVTGTPTVFINGRKLEQRSLEGFQNLIDSEVERLKQK